jgi:hypothetical protein
MLVRLDLAALPATVCWTWADRPPQPVRGTGPGWLLHWSRGKAIYTLR